MGLGLSWSCHGDVTGLSWGCHGVVMGLSWARDFTSLSISQIYAFDKCIIFPDFMYFDRRLFIVPLGLRGGLLAYQLNVYVAVS